MKKEGINATQLELFNFDLKDKKKFEKKQLEKEKKEGQNLEN